MSWYCMYSMGDRSLMLAGCSSSTVGPRSTSFGGSLSRPASAVYLQLVSVSLWNNFRKYEADEGNVEPGNKQIKDEDNTVELAARESEKQEELEAERQERRERTESELKANEGSRIQVPATQDIQVSASPAPPLDKNTRPKCPREDDIRSVPLTHPVMRNWCMIQCQYSEDKIAYWSENCNWDSKAVRDDKKVVIEKEIGGGHEEAGERESKSRRTDATATKSRREDDDGDNDEMLLH